MDLLYRLGIRIYGFALRMASPFSKKARKWAKGRSGWFEQMQHELNGEESLVWIHAASLGEFEQGRPLIEKWKIFFPGTKILLTFFSPSGYEIRKDYPMADYIYYMPLDTRKNAAKFIALVKPVYAIFIKYEYWYNFLFAAKESDTKVILISALFRPGQLFFKPYGNWYRKMLFCFDHIFVQDERSAELLMQFKQLNVSIAGDTRFDRVAEIARQAKTIELAEQFTKQRFTYVFGSTWPKDEDLIIEFINQDKSDACYIIAPHEIGPKHIQQLADRLHKPAALFSMAYGKEITKAKVLIIDNIGLLSSLYRYGNIAYIGGGFGKGIHNILEPAVYGMPVVFGPGYKKFREAVELVNEGGAFAINNYQEMQSVFHRLTDSRSDMKLAADATRQFVQRNIGATEAILNYLKNS